MRIKYENMGKIAIIAVRKATVSSPIMWMPSFDSANLEICVWDPTSKSAMDFAVLSDEGITSCGRVWSRGK